MDNRDRYLQQHHRRRLQVASGFDQERQRQDALRHFQIAVAQHRLAYACLMQCWLSEITEGK